jgi:hypothetical protein
VKVFAGVVGAALAVSIVALLVGAGSHPQTCQASGRQDFAFAAGLICVAVGALAGLAAIVQAIRRRRARPHFWWYIGTATAAAATVIVGTAAAASGFTFCFT